MRVRRPVAFPVCVRDPGVENGVCHPFSARGHARFYEQVRSGETVLERAGSRVTIAKIIMVISSHPSSDKMIFPAAAARRGQPRQPRSDPPERRDDDQATGRAPALWSGEARAAPEGRVSIVVDRVSVGAVLPAPGSSGLSGRRRVRSSAGARRAAASTISSGCIWGEPFLVVLIIFVVTMVSCLR